MTTSFHLKNILIALKFERYKKKRKFNKTQNMVKHRYLLLISEISLFFLLYLIIDLIYLSTMNKIIDQTQSNYSTLHRQISGFLFSQEKLSNKNTISLHAVATTVLAVVAHVICAYITW
ncbi:hypothetical protein ACJX0J_027713 [Zea mays]